MSKIKKTNLTKNNISKIINFKTGLPTLYTNEITNDFKHSEITDAISLFNDNKNTKESA